MLFEGLPELPPASNKTTPKADPAIAPLADRRGNRREDCPKRVGGALEDAGDFDELARDEARADPAGGVSDGVAQIPRDERSGDEQQHRVRITKPFYLGVYEVTQSEFEHVMGRNPSYFSNSGGQAEAATGVDTSRYPVDSVTWYDAVEFCNKLSEKEERQPYYRLADIERDARRFDQRGKGERRGGRRLSFADGSTMGIRLSGGNDNPLQLWDGQQWRRVQLQWQSALWDRGTKVPIWAGPSQSAVIDRMHSDCTTCTATCGMVLGIRGHRSARAGRRVQRGGAGTPTVRSAGRHSGGRQCRRTDSKVQASA